MKVIAIIPARGGSRRLKNKNVYPVLGKPMIEYTIDACKMSKYDMSIWVSTDSEYIKSIVRKLNISIHDRSKELSGDKVYKQAAIRSAANHIQNAASLDSENVIYLSIQANSPTITSKEIDECIDTLIKFNRDEIISVDSNLMQDASIRVFKGNYVFQKDLSTNCGVVVTNLYDVHTIDDVEEVEKILLDRMRGV
jgi:CMP-N-acetylneuraminic acid synthetase